MRSSLTRSAKVTEPERLGDEFDGEVKRFERSERGRAVEEEDAGAAEDVMSMIGKGERERLGTSAGRVREQGGVVLTHLESCG